VVNRIYNDNCSHFVSALTLFSFDSTYSFPIRLSDFGQVCAVAAYALMAFTEAIRPKIGRVVAGRSVVIEPVINARLWAFDYGI
jgi:hypothetical protein